MRDEPHKKKSGCFVSLSAVALMVTGFIAGLRDHITKSPRAESPSGSLAWKGSAAAAPMREPIQSADAQTQSTTARFFSLTSN